MEIPVISENMLMSLENQLESGFDNDIVEKVNNIIKKGTYEMELLLGINDDNSFSKRVKQLWLSRQEGNLIVSYSKGISNLTGNLAITGFILFFVGLLSVFFAVFMANAFPHSMYNFVNKFIILPDMSDDMKMGIVNNRIERIKSAINCHI